MHMCNDANEERKACTDSELNSELMGVPRHQLRLPGTRVWHILTIKINNPICAPTEHLFQSVSCFRLKAPSDRFICAPDTHVHCWNTLCTPQNLFFYSQTSKIKLYPLHIVLFCMSWMICEADQNRYFDAVLTVLDLVPVSTTVVWRE